MGVSGGIFRGKSPKFLGHIMPLQNVSCGLHTYLEAILKRSLPVASPHNLESGQDRMKEAVKEQDVFLTQCAQVASAGSKALHPQCTAESPGGTSKKQNSLVGSDVWTAEKHCTLLLGWEQLTDCFTLT